MRDVTCNSLRSCNKPLISLNVKHSTETPTNFPLRIPQVSIFCAVLNRAISKNFCCIPLGMLIIRNLSKIKLVHISPSALEFLAMLTRPAVIVLWSLLSESDNILAFSCSFVSLFKNRCNNLGGKGGGTSWTSLFLVSRAILGGTGGRLYYDFVTTWFIKKKKIVLLRYLYWLEVYSQSIRSVSLTIDGGGGGNNDETGGAEGLNQSV